MGLSVSTSIGLENRELLKQTASNILMQSGSTKEYTSKMVENMILSSSKELYTPAELSIQRASAQITINGTLRETLKYIKNHKKNESKKDAKFGDLWSIAMVNNQESENNPYHGELYDFKVDLTHKNIFAA